MFILHELDHHQENRERNRNGEQQANQHCEPDNRDVSFLNDAHRPELNSDVVVNSLLLQSLVPAWHRTSVAER